MLFVLCLILTSVYPHPDNVHISPGLGSSVAISMAFTLSVNAIFSAVLSSAMSFLSGFDV